MARDSIELNLDDATPSPGTPSRTRGSIQHSSRTQRSAFSDRQDDNERARRRNAGSYRSQPRAAAVHEQNVSELLINPEDIDLDELDNEEAQFLRTARRVPVRRGALAKKTAGRLKIVAIAAGIAALAGGLGGWAYSYGKHSWRFVVPSGDAVEITGVHNASLAHVREVAVKETIRRNVFFISPDEIKTKLEQMPWVEQATVMRLLPNRIAVIIVERTPVAFVQIGPRTSLIDAKGVVMGMPADRKTRYSFPVIRGISESDPLSSRAAAMKIYNRLVGELGSGDAGDAKYVQQLSEVDLSDPDDVKVTANDPGGTMVVHLGKSDFLPRYKLYVAHIAEWRQQFPNLQSVDLKFEGQVVVNPDRETANPPRRHGDTEKGEAVAKSMAPTVKPVSRTLTKSKKHPPQRTQRAQR